MIDCILYQAWASGDDNDCGPSHAQGGSHLPSDARAASSDDGDTAGETKEGLEVCCAGAYAGHHSFMYSNQREKQNKGDAKFQNLKLVEFWLKFE
jgi:hypothetical protein